MVTMGDDSKEKTNVYLKEFDDFACHISQIEAYAGKEEISEISDRKSELISFQTSHDRSC